MKRGKRFFENENLFIYGGTAVFFILAVALGIIMYMSTKTKSKVGENNRNDVVEQREIEDNNTESASSKIGKTVEEQEKNNETESTTNKTDKTNTTTSTNTKTENITTNKSETNTTNNTSVNAPVEDKKTTETKKELSFIKPVEGEILCEYAKDNLIYSETLKEWMTHTAIDIKADKTSVVKAAAAGVVKTIVNDPRYGLTVVIEHEDGYQTTYSNLLTAEFVVEGEEVKEGQTIGTVGNTAAFESNMECHLHFELLKDGEYLDPSIYLK